ncbi:MAG: glycosyltransferase family 9 protein [Candidatus Brocadiia bacterium]
MAKLREKLTRALVGAPRPSLVVFRAGGLGDTVLTLPTLRLVEAGAGGADLRLVGSAWAEELEPLIPGLRVSRFDDAALAPLFGPDPPAEGPDWLRSADAAVIYGAEPDECLVRSVRRLCGGTVVTWPAEPEPGHHAAAHLAGAVLNEVPHVGELPLPRLRVPAALREWATEWVCPRFGDAAPVAVHPGSGGRRKCWPPDRVAALIRSLDAPTLMPWGPADDEACRRVLELLPPPARPVLARDLTVARAAALLARCRAYAGNDSGLTHVAAALGVPTVAVFGPTDPAVWRPLGPAVRIVQGQWPEPDEVLVALDGLRGPPD